LIGGISCFAAGSESRGTFADRSAPLFIWGKHLTTDLTMPARRAAPLEFHLELYVIYKGAARTKIFIWTVSSWSDTKIEQGTDGAFG
jgi:hypothetical protein